MKDFATVAQPLNALLQKDAEFRWSADCETAWRELKDRLVSAPILGYPQPSGQLHLDTDASAGGIGAVLS